MFTVIKYLYIINLHYCRGMKWCRLIYRITDSVQSEIIETGLCSQVLYISTRQLTAHSATSTTHTAPLQQTIVAIRRQLPSPARLSAPLQLRCTH